MAQVEGIAQLISTLNRLPEQLKEEVQAATLDTANYDKQIAQQLSAFKTGFFRSRWQVRVKEASTHRVVVETFNDASYAIPLVFGHRTRSGSHVAPRDCVSPALLASRQYLARRLASIRLKGGH